jgi:hypothetical protein
MLAHGTLQNSFSSRKSIPLVRSDSTVVDCSTTSRNPQGLPTDSRATRERGGSESMWLLSGAKTSMKIPVLRIAVAVCLFTMFSGSVREASPLASPSDPHVKPPADCLPAYRPDLPCLRLDLLRQQMAKPPQLQYGPDQLEPRRVHIHTQEKTT